MGRSSWRAIHDDLPPRFVRHGVGRVRGEREREPRLVLQRVAHREAARQVTVGVRGVRGREVEHRQPQHRAHAELEERPRARVRKEVHVVAARDAAAQHLGGREARAVVDEVRPGEPRLARPDVVLEPDLERDVVRDAAKEIHRCVRMGVDEAGQQHVARQRDMLARLEFVVRARRRHDGDDAARVDQQRMIRERSGGLDRHDPAGVDAKVAGLHARSVTRKRNPGEKKAPRKRGFSRWCAGVTS